ncbi:MAG: tetratricopeptide repeat protein, partial [Sphingomicrobium sp.]
MTSAEAARLREQAVAAARGGRLGDAAALHDRAVALAPGDASILNSAALYWSKQGEAERAIALLRRAIDTDANNVEPLFNLCLILTGDGRANEALALLTASEPAMQGLARYWSIRAGAERALGRKRDALASYEVASQLDPANAKASHGRARMALETGQPAAGLYLQVVGAEPDNAEAWLGYAQALDADRRADEARNVLETLIAKAPDWTDALEALARLRVASGERDSSCNHYAAAVRQAPQAAVYASWSRMLAGVDRFAEAA